MALRDPRDPSDPKLVAASAEIREIMKKYDIGGMVTLASGNGHAEYGNYVTDPSWSVFSIETVNSEKAIRIRSFGSSAPVEPRLMERIKLQKSINMIVLLEQTLETQLQMTTALGAFLREKFKVEESSGIHTPHT